MIFLHLARFINTYRYVRISFVTRANNFLFLQKRNEHKKNEFIIIVMTWQVFECNKIISEIFAGETLEKNTLLVGGAKRAMQIVSNLPIR